ncbi:MAG: response regulator [Treponema sp.]|nr:response regulator [Treponema sp.]
MRETIFMVDDSATNLKIAKNVLREHYQVITMLSAVKMFEVINKIIPDLILLDIQMPEMDGFEALRILKETHADIPVMFLTSTIDAAVEAQGFQMGAIDFITKPFSAPVFINRIKMHLERTQQLKENKKLLCEIEQKRQEAESVNKAKSSFLSRMSHEIRTPMNAILGIAEMQLQKKSLESGIKEAFERIYASGDLLLGIINDILDLSKIEAGKMELSIGKYDIASLISDAAQLNIMRIGSKPITFELNIDEHLPAAMLGDEMRIKQILNNLLSNAFKYTASGTVTLTVTAQAGGNHDEVILVVSVKDTGQGMSKEQVMKLFDEYTRFNQDANRTTEGIGLGMSITRDIINLMKGNISVESECGLGSVFTVRIPQVKFGSEELGAEMAENLHEFRSNSRTRMIRSQITFEPMPYGNILVVDDVETNIYVAKGLLTRYELNIDSADSGYAAIEKIRSGKTYDVIFMDHMMPKLDGVETTKILRSMGYNFPVVALTANAVKGQADIFLENGFNDFISKPIDIRQMNRILNELIRDKQPPEVLENARLNSKRKEPRENETGKSAFSSDSSAQTLNETDAVADNAASFLSRTQIAGVDIAKGLERYNGDEDAYIMIMRSYAASVRSMLDAIETVYEETLAAYEVKVHGIKGTCREIFALDLAKDAEALEKAAVARDFNYINSNHQTFLKDARELIFGIENMLASLDSGDAKPRKGRPDSETLLKLREACEVYDLDNADAAMAEIEKYQYDSGDKLVGFLRKKFETMQFGDIVRELLVYEQSDK